MYVCKCYTADHADECWSVQVSLDQYHTEEEIYQMSLQREPRKPVVSSSQTFTINLSLVSHCLEFHPVRQFDKSLCINGMFRVLSYTKKGVICILVIFIFILS